MYTNDGTIDETVDIISDETLTDFRSLDKKAEKHTLTMLKSNPKIRNYIKELENICDNYNTGNEKNGCKKNMIVSWAYAGCVLTSLNGEKDPSQGLSQYNRRIDETLSDVGCENIKHYVPQIFEEVFRI